MVVSKYWTHCWHKLQRKIHKLPNKLISNQYLFIIELFSAFHVFSLTRVLIRAYPLFKPLYLLQVWTSFYFSLVWVKEYVKKNLFVKIMSSQCHLWEWCWTGHILLVKSQLAWNPTFLAIKFAQAAREFKSVALCFRILQRCSWCINTRTRTLKHT